jgi:predicted phage terminase large subunit-like protein
VWDWLETVALIRLEPGAAVIGITTRWHEDDAHGRLLARQPGRWRRLRLPALAEEGDPLGRAPGDALWPARYDVDDLHAIRAGMSARMWSALFDQNPTPAGGDIWKAEWFEDTRYALAADGSPIIDRFPVPLGSMRRYCVVDLATSTKTSADFTVIGTFGVAPQGRIVWLDCVRERMEGPDILPRIRSCMSRWGASLAWIEDSGYQLSMIQDARRRGIPVRTWGRKLDAGLRVEGDKVALAYSATPWAEAGKVWLPMSAHWLAQAEAEILGFPNAAHDDVADVFAAAIRIGQQMARGGDHSAVERRSKAPELVGAGFMTADTKASARGLFR